MPRCVELALAKDKLDTDLTNRVFHYLVEFCLTGAVSVPALEKDQNPVHFTEWFKLRQHGRKLIQQGHKGVEVVAADSNAAPPPSVWQDEEDDASCDLEECGPAARLLLEALSEPRTMKNTLQFLSENSVEMNLGRTAVIKRTHPALVTAISHTLKRLLAVGDFSEAFGGLQDPTAEVEKNLCDVLVQQISEAKL